MLYSETVTDQLENNTQLRQRTGRGERREEGSIAIRKRERSKERKYENKWEQFKHDVFKKFPNVDFPDQYVNDETNIITWSVSGASYNDIVEIVAMSNGAMTVNIDDDRTFLLEFDDNKYIPTPPVVVTPPKIKRQIPYKILIVSFLWLIMAIFTFRFVYNNLENYTKLL